MKIDILESDWEEQAALIRERVREKEIPISKIAIDLDWPRSVAAMIIRGQRMPSASNLNKLLEYLEIDASEIAIKKQQRIEIKGKKIFISYCHKDKEYLDRLLVHLKPLKKQGLVDPWVDTKLVAGDDWKKEIKTALNEARAAILLVSADFLASDFIVDNELPPLLQAAKEKGSRIIPVILKPCRFLRDKNLRAFQSVNLPEEPLSLVSENERELIYDTVAQQVEELFSTES